MGQNPFNIASTGESTPPPRTEPRQPKVPDPVKQRKCGKDSTREELCEESARCENDCDDMFSGRAEKTCLKLPTRLVYDFTELLDFTEDGDIDEIDSEVLECLLDIDDKEFIDAIKDMSGNQAEEFLAGIADDEDLANVFQDEDDNSDILRALLKEATGKNNIEAQLREDIDDGKTFLQLAAEGAEEAWDWLEDYVEDEYPNRDTIVTYCDVIVNGGSKRMRDSDLDDLLDTDAFEDEYEDEVTGDSYTYDTRGSKDFRAWCENEQIVTGPCPAGGSSAPPNSDRLLARITFKLDSPGGQPIYQSRNFCWRTSTTSESELQRSDSFSRHNTYTGKGSSVPNQNPIIRLGNYGELFLNKDDIDDIEEYNANSETTYYLYIESERIKLTNRYSYSNTDCTGATNEINDILYFELDQNKFQANSSYNIYLASEEDGECTYYQ